MGRPRRFRVAGIPQLVAQRGHNRLPCFIDAGDYQLFGELLRESAAQYECRVDALLMLPDAYWAVLFPATDDGLARTMQRCGRLYVRHVNHKYRRLGTLWAERYRACPLEPSDGNLAEVAAFLAALPGRRGVLAPGGEWPWWDSRLPAADDAQQPPDETTCRRIEAALQMGLAHGSEAFRSMLAQRSGLPTEPRRRGRPPRG